MFSRKFLAALITIVISFFIIPLFFISTEGWNMYFMIGLITTLYFAPIILVIGVPLSTLFETKYKNTSPLMAYFIYLIVGNLIAYIIYPVYLLVFVYVSVFFITDQALKTYIKKPIIF